MEVALRKRTGIDEYDAALFQDIDIGLRDLRIDEAAEAKPVIGADLRKANTSVARTRLDDECVRVNLAGLQSAFEMFRSTIGLTRWQRDPDERRAGSAGWSALSPSIL